MEKNSWELCFLMGNQTNKQTNKQTNQLTNQLTKYYYNNSMSIVNQIYFRNCNDPNSIVMEFLFFLIFWVGSIWVVLQINR
jgi:hypothetical protein